MWSDPEEITGWGLSPRGAGYLFGGDIVQQVWQLHLRSVLHFPLTPFLSSMPPTRSTSSAVLISLLWKATSSCFRRMVHFFPPHSVCQVYVQRILGHCVERTQLLLSLRQRGCGLRIRRAFEQVP
jgi:hypothetical protein